MKILNYFFAITLLFLFASCDPNDIPDENEMIGTWQVTSVELVGTATTTDSQGDVKVADFVGTGYDLDLQITIDENPNNYTVTGDINVMVTYELDGQTFELPWEEVGFIDSGTWEVANETLTVVSPSQVETASVSEITETSMILDWVYTQTDTQSGNTVVQNVSGTYVFEKL